MRRLLLGLVVLSPLGFGAATASGHSIAPPPEAKAWLGTWHTNQGEFRFIHVGPCAGNPNGSTPGCDLDGEWKKPGAGWMTIYGVVALGPYKGGHWQGCVPDYTAAPPGTRCEFFIVGSLIDVSIDRVGDKVTDGFWKDCPARGPCTTHHPILGKKVSGQAKCPAPRAVRARAASCGRQLRFGFRVDGFPNGSPENYAPNDLVSVEADTVDTKVVDIPGLEGATGKVNVTTTYLEPGTGTVEEHITFDVNDLFAGATISPESRMVVVDADVVASTDPHCPSGNTVAFTLKRYKGGAVLSLGAAPRTTKPCLFSRRSQPLIWKDLRRTPVSERHLKTAKIGIWEPIG